MKSEKKSDAIIRIAEIINQDPRWKQVPEDDAVTGDSRVVKARGAEWVFDGDDRVPASPTCASETSAFLMSRSSTTTVACMRLCASSGRRSARRTHSSALDGEFRRRTKAQGSLPSEDVVLLLLFGLLRTGNVNLRKMDGWQEMPKGTTVEIQREAA